MELEHWCLQVGKQQVEGCPEDISVESEVKMLRWQRGPC